MMDLNLLLRGGNAYKQYDTFGVATTVGNLGNLTATDTRPSGTGLDLGASLKQIPLDGAAAFSHIPVSSVTTTGAPTNFTLRQTLEYSDDGSSWLDSQVSQLLTFTVTSNSASSFTYTKDNTSTTVTLPCVLKMNTPYTPHRYARITNTIAFTAGSSPALDATGLGKVDCYFDEVGPIGLPWVDIT